MDVKSFFISYLLFPVVAFIAAAVMLIVNKKNKLLSNRRLLFTMLLTALILGVPGLLGFIGLQFMPWGYLFCQLAYLGLGTLYVWLASKHYETELLNKKWFFLLVTFVSCLLGVYLFKLGFNWLNDMKYGLWASTSIFAFLLPPIFWWAYIAFLSIPLEIYKVWQYPLIPQDISMEHLDFDRLMVLELDLYKNTTDPEPLKVKAKAPPNMNFGLWFQKFIDDYNVKFPKSTVQYKLDNNENYKWIFYTKPSFFKQRHFLDPDLDIQENRISESVTIFAKRVSEIISEPDQTGDQAVYL
jgi:hypothetical protein